MLHVATVCTRCCMLIHCVLGVVAVKLLGQQLSTFFVVVLRSPNRSATSTKSKGETPRLTFSRVGRFSRELAFRSLYYPGGKMWTTHSLSATMLDPWVQLFIHCWDHARALHMVLWIESFPRCTAGPNIVGNRCIRLHTTANTDATTPTNAGQKC